MTQDPSITAEMSRYAHFIRPERGRWQRVLVNLLLRLLVKWRITPDTLVERLRSVTAQVNRRAAQKPLRVVQQQVDCNGVAAEWLIPSSCKPSRVLLYLHGGAFIAHAPDAYAAMLAPWCEALQARALMVDYRLAPEHTWPAAPDDCYAAWSWLLEQGHAPADIVIAGNSAGGNLALATLHRIKAAGTAMPACAVLLSPFVDFTLAGESMVRNARRDPIFSQAFANSFRHHYIGPEHYLEPSASPLFGNFAGLPPLLLQTGSMEVVRDDSVRTAARAHAAGVEVRLEIWERMPHDFQVMADLPQALQAAVSILSFIDLHTAWQSAPDVDGPATGTCPQV
ncbi:alpha/beta hydrolase [Pseudomonas sp. NPDC077649]|uniref:alpha/beta hydrolase n=1 Tax=Pseudomonas sp. NPDC077649 TaxID=3364423 RepID=UPI0037C9A47A